MYFFRGIVLLVFVVTQVIFVCILWQCYQSLLLWNKMSMLFVRGMDVSREQYNLKHYGNRKILLLETCLLYLYLNPDWVVQYLGTYHNNVTHIYSVVVHYV